MRTVIVTGASRCIGAATCRFLVAQGLRVIGVARDEGPLALLELEKIGGGGHFAFVLGDVAESSTATRAVALAVAEGHQLVGLVLNAG